MQSVFRKLATFLIIPLLVGCSGGGAEVSSSQTPEASPQGTFQWSEDALSQVAISKSDFESWGLADGPGSQSGTSAIATDEAGLLNEESASTNPSECIALYSFYSELKNHLPGDYYLFQEHYDAGLSNFTKLLVVGFSSDSEAQASFDQIKSLANTCKSFEAKRGSEIKSIGLWDSLSLDVLGYIQGESLGKTAAFGIVGSAIWYQEVVTQSGEEAKALDAIAKSRTLLTSKLGSVQGK